MYHRVEALPPTPGYLPNYVFPEQFDQQLAALVAWGYTSITLEQWVEIRAGRGRAPKRPIAITFDDGYRSIYENAWPMLRRRSMTATVFLIAGCIGETNRLETNELQDPLLNKAEIAEMKEEGISFGSHTLTHRPLTGLPQAEALEELVRSRTALETLLSRPVTTIAYPYNKHNRRIRALARLAGYHAAVLGRGRLNTLWTNPHALMRIAINAQTTAKEFESRLCRQRYATGL
jgi:peptidoglycan/xylan/chitin deacetylase (PgdA/CDA1 family)